ncbi:MAG: repeat subfamily [Phenylobacterium sp.]|nr:repeat subfamily [Phenylobacterium sp.]
MNTLLALALAFALAVPAAALPAPPHASPNQATAPPADDAHCDTCDALQLMYQGDYRRGRHILEMRAATGDAFAVTGLGMMYQNGWGVPVDYARAMGSYQTAAHQGDLMALNQIGYLVLHGLGRPADPKAAWC